MANYIVIEGSDAADMAFAVADSEQRRGIGMRLLEQLARRARGSGIARFRADVLASNSTALGVFADAGFEVVRQRDAEEVEVRFPIVPTVEFEARVEQRDHTAVVASLRPFFEPESVAVIGASRRRGSIEGDLLRNILAADFAGSAYPVNLRRRARRGRARVSRRSTRSPTRSISPSSACPASTCWTPPRPRSGRGVRALCVISAGFAEIGHRGPRAPGAAARRSCGRTAARLVGPNCLGIAVAWRTA